MNPFQDNYGGILRLELTGRCHAPLTPDDPDARYVNLEAKDENEYFETVPFSEQSAAYSYRLKPDGFYENTLVFKIPKTEFDTLEWLKKWRFKGLCARFTDTNEQQWIIGLAEYPLIQIEENQTSADQFRDFNHFALKLTSTSPFPALAYNFSPTLGDFETADFDPQDWF